MKRLIKKIFSLFITLILAGCTSGSLTEQFLADLSADRGILEVEVTQHLQDGTGGEITPAGSKIFTNDLGYVIELKEAIFSLHELNLISDGNDPLCQGGRDQNIPIDAIQDLLGEDLIPQHLNSALIPMGFFCQFELILGSEPSTLVKFHEGEVQGDAPNEPLHLSGTWTLGGESGEFDLIGVEPISIQDVFKTEEAGELLEHPLHFHEGETVLSVLFETEYDVLLNGVEFKTQPVELQLETVYQNIPDAIHQDPNHHH
jgi:hypothetical protein